MMPAIMDLGGNISAMAYIWISPVSQGTQFAYLVALAIREFIEMVASIGVVGVTGSIWYFNRFDYFMIDVATDEAIRNAALMSIGDFALYNFRSHGIQSLESIVIRSWSSIYPLDRKGGNFLSYF